MVKKGVTVDFLPSPTAGESTLVTLLIAAAYATVYAIARVLGMKPKSKQDLELLKGMRHDLNRMHEETKETLHDIEKRVRAAETKVAYMDGQRSPSKES